LPSKWPSKLFSLKVLTNSFYETAEVISTSPKKMEIKISEGTGNQAYLLTFKNPL
jgi:hypothetical protein